jgi:arylsulfatase A-like enzyme
MKARRALCLALLAASAVAAFPARSAAASPPNILVLVADDLGYADVGFNGGKEIRTPEIDKLAAGGARLTQYYVQPVCSPTRAALLTGRYPMRYGLQVGVLRPWEKRGLPLEERLLPQALKEAGYTTAIVGKWHLGHYQPEYLPTRRGFDHQYGQYCGAIDYFTHERDGGHDWHRDDRDCRDEGYSTHLLAREAVRLISNQPAGKPLFLYVAFNAVHAPHQVPESYKAPYAGLAEPRRTYAGMVAAMDEAIGQILAALDFKGMRTNTLVLFFSDNGGPNPGKVTDNTPLRAGKGTVYEGGTRVCACAAWQGRIQPGSVVSTPLHAVDWFPTLVKLAGAPMTGKLPLDGLDIWPVLAGGTSAPHRDILLNTAPASGALRFGDWKVIVHSGGASGDEETAAPAPRKKKRQAAASAPKAELFNLAEDVSEKNNLAERQPEKLKELLARYEALAKRAAKPGNQPQPAGYKAPRVWGEAEKN